MFRGLIFFLVRKQQEQLKIREEQAEKIRAEKIRLQEIAENERELQLVEQQRKAERATYFKSVPPSVWVLQGTSMN